MKIILLKTSIEPGGNLNEIIGKILSAYPYLAMTHTSSEDGKYLILDDKGSRDNLNINQSKLELLVANGGDIEEGIFAIKVDDTFKDLPINAGMPFEKNVFGENRTYANWFVHGAQVYKEDAGNGYIFYTNPGAGIANASQYLKASQIKIIIDLAPSFSCMSTQKFKANYEGNGWSLIDWKNL